MIVSAFSVSACEQGDGDRKIEGSQQPDPTCVSLADSKRIVTMLQILASDRVAPSVQRQFRVPSGFMLRPMVPDIRVWLSAERLSLTRVTQMHDDPDFGRVCERFDECLREMIRV